MNIMKRRHKQEDGHRGADLARSQGRDESGLSRLRHEMDRVFDRVLREFDRDPWSMPSALGSLSDWPAMDMAEDDKSVTLRVDIPGLDARDVDVEVSGNLLTVRGQRDDEWSDTKGGVHRRERRSGSFARTVTLPSYADAEKVEARYDKGTLTLTVPKIPGKGPKRVSVSAS